MGFLKKAIKKTKGFVKSKAGKTIMKVGGGLLSGAASFIPGGSLVANGLKTAVSVGKNVVSKIKESPLANTALNAVVDNSRIEQQQASIDTMAQKNANVGGALSSLDTSQYSQKPSNFQNEQQQSQSTQSSGLNKFLPIALIGGIAAKMFGLF